MVNEETAQQEPTTYTFPDTFNPAAEKQTTYQSEACVYPRLSTQADHNVLAIPKSSILNFIFMEC